MRRARKKTLSSLEVQDGLSHLRRLVTDGETKAPEGKGNTHGHPGLGVEPRVSSASLSCHPLMQACEPLGREAWVMRSYCVVKSPGSAQACLITKQQESLIHSSTPSGCSLSGVSKGWGQQD